MPLNRTAEGKHHFSGVPLLIRKAGAPLTANWVLSSAFTGPLGHGTIGIDRAGEVTFFASASFGSTPCTDIRIKPVFLTRPVAVANVLVPVQPSSGPTGGHFGVDLFSAADGAALQASRVFHDYATSVVVSTVFTSAIQDANFGPWLKGQYLQILSGTNDVPGSYRIIGANDLGSGNWSLIIEGDCTTGGDMSVAVFAIASEYQELALTTAAGVTTGDPSEIIITSATMTGATADAADGANVCWTQRLPSAGAMRVFCRATGTVTATSLELKVAFNPLGAQ